MLVNALELKPSLKVTETSAVRRWAVEGTVELNGSLHDVTVVVEKGWVAVGGTDVLIDDVTVSSPSLEDRKDWDDIKQRLEAAALEAVDSETD